MAFIVALPSSESLVSPWPKSKQHWLLVMFDDMTAYNPSGDEPVGRFFAELSR